MSRRGNDNLSISTAAFVGLDLTDDEGADENVIPSTASLFGQSLESHYSSSATIMPFQNGVYRSRYLR